MFVGLHVVLAERTETPEIVISEEEGKQFMSACQNVMRHYSVETTQKTLDVISLIGCTVAIYAPRIAAIQVRRKFENMKSANPRRRPGEAQSAPQPEPFVMPPAPDDFDHAGF